MSASGPLASVASAIHDVLAHIARVLTSFSVLDWVFVGLGIYAACWGWARVLAFVRLGDIQIDDPVTDAGALDPITAKADLQEQLAKRGDLPPSGVPSGSPTVASVAAAITAAPIPQANWLGALIELLPKPPTSTGFRLTVTLVENQARKDSYGLIYKLVCSGPRPSVTIDDVWAADQTTLFDQASKEIFLRIGTAAPDIYPRWARFDNLDALKRYRDGIECERHPELDAPETKRYRKALDCYREASRRDPDNMLARLRIANCLERIAAQDDIRKQMEALLEYMAIRAREPTIFEAGYRASVLLIGLAEDVGQDKIAEDQLRVLRDLLRRTRLRDKETAGLGARWVTWRRPRRRDARTEPRPILTETHFNRASKHESELARMRLRPLWTMINERRFRHRFEPRGSDRRHLRRALGVSYWAIRARQARRARDLGEGEPPNWIQFVWNGWVYWRYLAGRARIAGWQAHYNAACFYALLPLSDHPVWSGVSERIRGRALRHLGRAIDQDVDGAMSFVYVRDEDPDLQVLRKLSIEEFERIVRRLRPDEFTLRYRRSDAFHWWELDVLGGAVEATTVRPISASPDGAVYRIKIVDETKPLKMRDHRSRQEDVTWEVVLARFDSSQAWVFPGDRSLYRDKRRTVAYRPEE